MEKTKLGRPIQSEATKSKNNEPVWIFSPSTDNEKSFWPRESLKSELPIEL